MNEIPTHKKSDSELEDLRRNMAFSQRPSAQPFKPAKLSLPLTLILYMIAIASIVLVAKGIIAIGLSVAAFTLLLALLVFWKKPADSHHASFITMISLLVLVFGSVYSIEKFEPKAHEEPQRPTRY